MTHRRGSGDVGQLPELYSIIKGEVASIQDYGVFIKIPGCSKNGLVHISQMSSSRVDKASDVCELGEKVHCKVISVEGDGSKIALSMKAVNQRTGQDLDPNNVQANLDAQKKRTPFQRNVPRIELGAIYDTTCKKCGGKGHLAQDCFHKPGAQTYELIEESFSWPTTSTSNQIACTTDSTAHSTDSTHEKKKKSSKDKKKKHKHHKTRRDSGDRKKRKHDSDADETKKKRHKHSSAYD